MNFFFGTCLECSTAHVFRPHALWQYLVAARKEQDAVGVPERISGLPTLLILKPNGDIIDRDGVERVKEDGAQALEKWLRA